MGTAEIRSWIIPDAAMMGLRAAVGVVFIVHGMQKFNPGFAHMLDGMGMSAAMQVPIALAEVVPGVLLLIGILTRMSSGLLCIVMLGAIFVVKGATSFSGDRGTEFDIVLLAAALVIVAAGPGRISLAHITSRLPRFIH